ncbi:hypothetical protein RSM62_003626 [Morganella morganii]|uniref:hypothetical protein n=1 Tax=Morganella morganii TaxID=582 RepID=UPI0028BA5E15|nr:hypothetical protein [Morganella morganii]
MKKIGDVTSTADKNSEWTNGNVAAGIAPTILDAGWLNSVQREILGVLTKAGIPQDKNNDTQLAEAISAIISGGNYATKTEVNSKLAKDQNGADIPNKDTFIKNLGLPELLDKKFDKTGGKITGQTDIEAPGGRTQTLKAKAGTSVYQELYLQDIFAAWWGITAGNKLSLENRITRNTLTIGSDGFKIDGKDIATTDQLFGAGQTYRNLTTSRQNKVWYTNTDSKPRIVHIETNRTGTQYPFSIDIQVIHDGIQHRADYRWTTADEVICLTALIPPGARFSVNGGWAQPTEWVVISNWLEFSL